MRAFKHILAVLACIVFYQTGHAVQIRRNPGTRVPESVLPTDRDRLPAQALRYTSYTKGAAPESYAKTYVPRKGRQDILLVLVDFTDRKFALKDTDALIRRYDRMFNLKGYADSAAYTHQGMVFCPTPGSVSDYFTDQSYGLYTPRFRVVGPVHLSNGYAYYGADTNGQDKNTDLIVREICDQLMENDTVDLEAYVDNKPLTQLCFIYAGQGQNFDGADSGNIWPHVSDYTYNYAADGNARYMNFIYACSCELFWNSTYIPDGIGVFCHEFAHTLGLPDFYSTNFIEDAAMGYWSLMDYGNYENGDFSPVGLTAFEKYSLGWLDPEEINSPGTYALSDISKAPNPEAGIHTAYRLSTSNNNRYILLENHSRTGWYSFQAAQGLLVTAVNYNSSRWEDNTVNNKRPYGFSILPADNDFNRDSNNGDLYPYNGRDSITPFSQPALVIDRTRTQYSVYGIEMNQGVISFTASREKPTSVTAQQDSRITITVSDGACLVTAPAGSCVTVHDISGKAVLETHTTQPTQSISLPGPGIWIIRCGSTVRKIRL